MGRNKTPIMLMNPGAKASLSPWSRKTPASGLQKMGADH